LHRYSGKEKQNVERKGESVDITTSTPQGREASDATNRGAKSRKGRKVSSGRKKKSLSINKGGWYKLDSGAPEKAGIDIGTERGQRTDVGIDRAPDVSKIKNNNRGDACDAQDIAFYPYQGNVGPTPD